MNNNEMDTLKLFVTACEGESEMSDHTPRTTQTGEEGASVAGEQSNTSREEEFRALMEGEYKDLFTAYFQDTFNRRFKEHKQIKTELESTRAVLKAIKERYGEQSDEALLDAIRAETILKNAPTEAQKPPERTVSQEELESVRIKAQEQLLAHIRTRGMRPSENALSAQNSHAGGVQRLTREERAEMARRAANGERIEL